MVCHFPRAGIDLFTALSIQVFESGLIPPARTGLAVLTFLQPALVLYA
jgi:hypothetical protein